MGQEEEYTAVVVGMEDLEEADKTKTVTNMSALALVAEFEFDIDVDMDRDILAAAFRCKM